MGRQLDKLTIRGFKSIEALDDFKLRRLNVLIGANGAGKSNFVEFFQFLREMVEERLQAYVLINGPSDGFFFRGIKHTEQITSVMEFGSNRYRFELKPAADGMMMIAREYTHYTPATRENALAVNALESRLKRSKDDAGTLGRVGPNWYVWDAVSSWVVYHFHDTSRTAKMRREEGIEQTARLQTNADNLAPFLLGLRNEHRMNYDAIQNIVRRVAPLFKEFVLKVRETGNQHQVRLTWLQKDSDFVFSPTQLSDGTIRFICLATALLQPNPPSTIVIDEPELGLHPEALSLLAGLMRSASAHTQIITTTQSPTFLSHFDPEDVITVDNVGGASRFARLDGEALAAWLDDYSLGELWQKGTVGGGGINYE